MEITDESGVETDLSSDSTIFSLLNKAEKRTIPGIPRSFANILQHLNRFQEVSLKIFKSLYKLCHCIIIVIVINSMNKNNFKK